MKNKELKISQITSIKESKDLDNLLWQVLWKPLSLSQNISETFQLTGKAIKFAASKERKLIGGLVAYFITPKEIEIRHIAVLPQFQRKSIGSALVKHLVSYASEKGCDRVYTIARTTSVDFFVKLGFKVNPHQKPQDHPAFIKHGITFHLLELYL
ncbi:MAG: GNAT family N-acetyltransferase [Clostridiaceae bacterium]|nr:GNAT family N-acetyltransferase [Clostridiaceae bacterium]